MSAKPSDHLLLVIEPTAESDNQETEELTRRLRTELEPISELEVSRVRQAGVPPLGSKGDAFSLRQLALSFFGSGGALAGTVSIIRSSLKRQNANGIEPKCGDVSIKIKEKSTEDQRRMVDERITRIEQTPQNTSKKTEGKASAFRSNN